MKSAHNLTTQSSTMTLYLMYFTHSVIFKLSYVLQGTYTTTRYMGRSFDCIGRNYAPLHMVV